jgi:amicyanin
MAKTNTRLHTFAIAAAVSALSVLFGLGATAGQAGKSPQAIAIDIDNFKFGVGSLEVAAGTTVTWTNRDDVPHTVTSSAKAFKSPALDTGEAFSYTFKDAGTFEYYCSLHPHMTAKVVVR